MLVKCRWSSAVPSVHRRPAQPRASSGPAHRVLPIRAESSRTSFFFSTPQKASRVDVEHRRVDVENAGTQGPHLPAQVHSLCVSTSSFFLFLLHTFFLCLHACTPMCYIIPRHPFGGLGPIHLTEHILSGGLSTRRGLRLEGCFSVFFVFLSLSCLRGWINFLFATRWSTPFI